MVIAKGQLSLVGVGFQRALISGQLVLRRTSGRKIVADGNDGSGRMVFEARQAFHVCRKVAAAAGGCLPSGKRLQYSGV